MGSRLRVVETPLKGLHCVYHDPISDERGELERLFCADELVEVLAGDNVAQVNRTLTKAVGAVRGMHFQRPPSAEQKFVTCLRGRVFDVAVDLRRGSDTYFQWHGVELSPGSNLTFAIPAGFAHGFQVLEPDSELLYMHTNFYDPSAEAGLSPLDPAVGITWPLPVSQLSDRDRDHPVVDASFEGVKL